MIVLKWLNSGLEIEILDLTNHMNGQYHIINILPYLNVIE